MFGNFSLVTTWNSLHHGKCLLLLCISTSLWVHAHPKAGRNTQHSTNWLLLYNFYCKRSHFEVIASSTLRSLWLHERLPDIFAHKFFSCFLFCLIVRFKSQRNKKFGSKVQFKFLAIFIVRKRTLEAYLGFLPSSVLILKIISQPYHKWHHLHIPL